MEAEATSVLAAAVNKCPAQGLLGTEQLLS